MLRRTTERIRTDESGFTLIELLVVVLIIGILSGIAIPAFLGQREKAQDSEAKTVVRTAASAAKAYFTDNQTYVGMSITALRRIEPSLAQGQGSSLFVDLLTPTGYRLRVTTRNGNRFYITENLGIATRTCTTAAKGGCPRGGRW